MRKIVDLFDFDLKLKFIFLILFMTLASFLELMGLGLVIVLLNSFLGIKNDFLETINNLSENFFQINFDYNFDIIIIFIFILFTFKLLILIIVAWMQSEFLANFREKISNKIYHNFLNRDVKDLLKKNSAEYIRNFTEEIQASNQFITSNLRIILDSILLVTFFIFLVRFNPTVTTIVFVFFSLLGLIYYIIVKDKLSTWAHISLENRKKKIQLISESFLAIKSIKILSRENFFFDKFKSQIRSISRIQFRVSFLGELPRNFFEYILFISILLLFIYLTNKQYENEVIIQLISVYTLVAFRLVPIVNRFLGNMQRLKHTYPSMKKLIAEKEQKIYLKENKNKKIEVNKSLRLIVKNFSFNNYRDTLFENIDLKIIKNSQIGIIGESGVGKSTIIDILCGFLRHKNSVLSVDGKQIFRTKNLEYWQNSIGYVPQNIIILNQSIRENILFGADKKIYSDHVLMSLLRKVELEYLIKNSKEGLSGILKQDGQNISGGEKQRIGIARALINDPSLLILDESTSGLDIETEKNIMNTINKLKITSIIISHRFSAFRYSDKLYLLKNKKSLMLNQKNISKYFKNHR